MCKSLSRVRVWRSAPQQTVSAEPALSPVTLTTAWAVQCTAREAMAVTPRPPASVVRKRCCSAPPKHSARLGSADPTLRFSVCVCGNPCTAALVPAAAGRTDCRSTVTAGHCVPPKLLIRPRSHAANGCLRVCESATDFPSVPVTVRAAALPGPEYEFGRLCTL
jgi:hypothetical protein